MTAATHPFLPCPAGARRQIPALVLAALVWAAAIDLRAQETPETLGRIEGDDIAVKGQVSLKHEGGRRAAALSSGSEVTVRSGQARMVLEEGGEMDVCGPAQFTVLKNDAAITLALNFGRLHLRISPTRPFTVYSALMIATPVSIGGEPRDQVIGLEATGNLCAFALRGAVRLEQQLTGASIVLPEGGEIELPDGQLESLRESSGNCRCDVVLAEDLPQRPKPPEAGVGMTRSGNENQAPDKKDEPKAAREDPKWTVVMPPLVFDASSASPPPEPNPEAARLHREAREPPAGARAGKGEARGAAPQKNPSAEAHPSPEQKPATEQKGGFVARVKNFFRRIFGGKRKT